MDAVVFFVLYMYLKSFHLNTTAISFGLRRSRILEEYTVTTWTYPIRWTPYHLKQWTIVKGARDGI